MQTKQDRKQRLTLSEAKQWLEAIRQGTESKKQMFQSQILQKMKVSSMSESSEDNTANPQSLRGQMYDDAQRYKLGCHAATVLKEDKDRAISGRLTAGEISLDLWREEMEKNEKDYEEVNSLNHREYIAWCADLKNAFPDAVEVIGKVMDDVIHAIEAIYKKIVATFESMVEKIYALVDKIWDFIYSTYQEVYEWIDGVLYDIF